MKISMNDVLFYALSIFLVGLVLGFLIGVQMKFNDDINIRLAKEEGYLNGLQETNMTQAEWLRRENQKAFKGEK